MPWSDMSARPTGDAAQFEDLLRPHLERLYRLAFRLTGEVADAEDLLQDVLIKLYERRDELTSIAELGPWISRVLYNRFVDNQRYYARRRLTVVDAGGADAAAENPWERFPTPEPGPQAAAARELDITRLSEALRALSLDHRTVLLMHDSEGYKLEEIHRITGVPMGTLKSRLHRARARVRELLTHDGTFSPPQACLRVSGQDHEL